MAAERTIAFAALASVIGLAGAFGGSPADAARLRPGANTGAPRTLAIAEDRVAGRRVSADAGAPLQILFADGSTMTLAPASALVIDSFVHDADGPAALVMTLDRGVFRFIGAKGATTEQAVMLKTPFGDLSVRRAGVEIDLGDATGPAHADLVFGDSMALAAGGPGQTVFRAGYSIVPSDGARAAIRKTSAAWREAIRARLAAPPRRTSGDDRDDGIPGRHAAQQDRLADATAAVAGG